jgi:hypothetical protein
MWLKTLITGINTIYITIMKPPKMRKELFNTVYEENTSKNVTMFTKADKGNSIIILKVTNCGNKITDFINSSDFTLLNVDSTQA